MGFTEESGNWRGRCPWEHDERVVGAEKQRKRQLQQPKIQKKSQIRNTKGDFWFLIGIREEADRPNKSERNERNLTSDQFRNSEPRQ